MKTIALILLTSPLFAQLQTDDRFLHATYSGLITGTTAGYLHWKGVKKVHAITLGVATALAVGTIKEAVIDTEFSGKDMKYNALGIASVAVAFTLPLPGEKKRKTKKTLRKL